MEVARHGRRGEAPLLHEVDAVGLEEFLGRRPGGGGLGDGHDPQAAKVLEQRRHPLGGAPQNVACGSSRSKEVLHTLGREITSAQTLPGQPPTDMGHHMELICDRVAPIALALEFRTEPGHVGDERAHDLDPGWITHSGLLSGLHLQRKPGPIRTSGLC